MGNVRHASGAAKAAGAISTALTVTKAEAEHRYQSDQKSTPGPLGEAWEDCGSMTADSSPILGGAKGHGEELFRLTLLSFGGHPKE